MKAPVKYGNFRLRSREMLAFLFFAAQFWIVAPACAQDSHPGPLTAPPEHDVRRMSNEAAAEAPPDLPAEEIIKRFSKKEDEYLIARTHFWFRKTIRLQEFGPDGAPTGEVEIMTEPAVTSDGTLYDKIVKRQESTMHSVRLVPGDIETLGHVLAYPLTTGQLAKYNLKYVGKEQVDEIDCYVFQAKPKSVERTHPYFDGIVWVDAKYLEVVKTYGKWVTDLGDVHSPTLPFTLFETYRENVAGKYWFPSYARSDDTLHFKDGDMPIRLVIKWTDFKQIPGDPTMAPPAANSPKPLR